MKTSKSILIILGAIVVVGGLYWWSSMYKSVPTQQKNEPAAVSVLNLDTDNTTLGNYLVAPNGMTLYYFTKDTAGASNCYNACATNWPPYVFSPAGSLAGGTGVSGNISTITRTDGAVQLTYNGAPLYFWSKDVKPGDATGQNFGGVWFVVKP
jgi:predicted lipoprotein with Yx(FWY)xxD motif